VGFERLLWLAVGLTLLGDVLLTAYGLGAGFREANPIMRLAIEWAGIGGLGLAKLLVVGTGGTVRLYAPKYGPTIALGLALTWGVTVLINLVQLAW
jgi:hypothetical protein